MLTDGAEWHCYRCDAIPSLPVQGCWPRYEGRDNPHPCYLGASYLNCGWSWLYECWQEEQELHWCQRPIPWTIASGLRGLWPHLCGPRSGRCFQYDARAWEHQ